MEELEMQKNLQMKELLKNWEQTSGTHKSIVDIPLNSLKNKVTQYVKQPKRVTSESNVMKERSKKKLISKGQVVSKIKTQEPSSNQVKLPRICKLNKNETKETMVVGNRKNTSAKIKVEDTYEQENKLFENLCQFGSLPDSDSFESDHDEEKGLFTAADKVLILDKLSKELEKRENIIKTVQRDNDLAKVEMNKENGEFSAYDEQLNKIVNEYFDGNSQRETKRKLSDKERDKKKRDALKAYRSDLESDESDIPPDLEKNLLKITNSLDKRMNDYKEMNAGFSRYFDPVFGVTSRKLDEYFEREAKADTSKYQKYSTILDDIDRNIDVLHPLSTEEKRKSLEKLLNDLKLQSSPQSASTKRTTSNREKGGKVVNNGSIKTNIISNQRKKKYKNKEKETKQHVGFRIMLSDVSTSGEEYEEESEIEEKPLKEEPKSFKEKCETIIKHLKDSNVISKPKSGVERLIARYKRKQREEEYEKKEFARWFGDTIEKETKHQKVLDVPCWKPGWTRLDSRLREAVLKDNWEGKRHLRKTEEGGDVIEEYRRQSKEYEQLIEGIARKQNKYEREIGDKTENEGERWIKIQKGTLLRDYQVRWRQGFYYLVEKKHTQKGIKKQYSKKRMIRATAKKAKKDVNIKHINKKNVKNYFKRYLGTKKESKTVKEKRTLYTNRGEAVKELRKILSRLKSRELLDDKKKIEDKSESVNLVWTRRKLTHHYKEKCKGSGIEVSESEEEDLQATFRKYCALYHERSAEDKEIFLKKKEEEMYPLGLFKSKEIIADDNYESDVELGQELTGEDIKKLNEKEESFFYGALMKEVFDFWSPPSDHIQRKKTIQNYNSSSEECLRENLPNQIESTTNNHITELLTIPKPRDTNKCSDQFNLPPDLYKRFFGDPSKKQLDIPFKNEYLTNTKLYLKSSTSQPCSELYTEVISEMRHEGLLPTVNYEFIKKNEALIPWNEVEVKAGECIYSKVLKINNIQEEVFEEGYHKPSY